jgi:hypothetical protein
MLQMDSDEIPIDQLLDKNVAASNGQVFAQMPKAQGSLQVPITDRLPTGLGQGSRTEYFPTSSYIPAIVIAVCVFLVASEMFNKVFKGLGFASLVSNDNNKLTFLGMIFVTFFTLAAYFTSVMLSPSISL